MATRAFLRRERLFGDGGDYGVQVGREIRRDDGLRIDMGPVTGAWWDVPLPACPDCGDQLVWAENGYVPGTRQCASCGSLFSVKTETQPEPKQEPERLRYSCDNGHVWYATEAEDREAGHKCPKCGEYWT